MGTGDRRRRALKGESFLEHHVTIFIVRKLERAVHFTRFFIIFICIDDDRILLANKYRISKACVKYRNAFVKYPFIESFEVVQGAQFLPYPGNAHMIGTVGRISLTSQVF